MRILYVTSLSMNEQSGAQHHVKEVVQGMRNFGAEVDLISPATFERGPLGAIKRKIEMASLVERTIQQKRPDVVYCRYEGADYLSIRKIIKAKLPCIVEINTKTIPELLVTKRYLPYVVSLLTERWIFRKVSGIAAVSPEIGSYAENLGGRKLPFLLAKNGVDLAEVQFHGYDPSLRKHHDTPIQAPLLVMIGSLATWHGVDLLVDALAEDCLKEFHVWLIGNLTAEDVKKISKSTEVLNRVHFLGWQNPTQLGKTLSAADVGVGVLALHRKKIEVTQALKPRTYFAAGLPTFLGYQDPVVLPDQPFIEGGVSSSPQEIACKIAAFYHATHARRGDLGQQARTYAERYLSWDVSAQETLRFIEEVVAKTPTAVSVS